MNLMVSLSSGITLNSRALTRLLVLSISSTSLIMAVSTSAAKDDLIQQALVGISGLIDGGTGPNDAVAALEHLLTHGFGGDLGNHYTHDVSGFELDGRLFLQGIGHTSDGNCSLDGHSHLKSLLSFEQRLQPALS